MEQFNEVIAEIRMQKDLEKFRNLCEEQGKRLVIFGVGDCGHFVYHTLHNAKIEPDCFCDNHCFRQGDEKTGLEIISSGCLYNTLMKIWRNKPPWLGYPWGQRLHREASLGGYDETRGLFDVIKTFQL